MGMIACRNTKIVILLLALFVIVNSISHNVSAACVTPSENMVINTNTVLCSGTYHFSDSNKDGALQIGSDNIVLDCNGASLIGSAVSGSIGIKDQYSDKENVTIKNCIIKNI